MKQDKTYLDSYCNLKFMMNRFLLGVKRLILLPHYTKSRLQFSRFHKATSKHSRFCSRVHSKVPANLQCIVQYTDNNYQFKFLNNFHTSCLAKAIVPFKLSDIGEGIKEVEVLEWYVSVGDVVSQFDSICEVQSDKASVTITSRFDGTVKKLHFAVGDVAQVGNTLIDIDVAEESTEAEPSVTDTAKQQIVVETESSSPSPPISSAVDSVSSAGKVLATPAVRGLAKEHHINLADVQGSGDNGRILKEDILKHLGMAEQPSTQLPPTPKVSAYTVDRVEPIKGIRKAMLSSMNAALLIPHFGYDDEYDMTELVELRYRLKKHVKHAHGLKLSYMPFIIKATSLALTQYPILNSQIETGNENLIYKADHNISIATDTPHGLLLPCIKSVQNLTVLEIASELNRLHEAGLKNKISPDDIAGGTFSLSNIGNIGGTYARPVIFPPQVAIGALGRIQDLPRFDKDGDVTRRSIMCMSWSGDHRVIEGAVMARFSNALKDYLENPGKMLLHLK